MNIERPSHLSDNDLMTEVRRLVSREHEATAHLIAHLAEVESRELYLGAGFSSLYMYCHEGLGFSEDAAYNRKTAAEVARRYPVVLDMLADGRVNLTVVRLLFPVLTDDNHGEAFAAATGKSKREVAELVARLDPKPDVPSSIRKLPSGMPVAVPEREKGASGQSVAEAASAAGEAVPRRPILPSAHRPIVAPLAPERYRVQFTVGKETEVKLRRLQELLRREIPDGDPGAIFDRALDLLLHDVEKKKLAATDRPRAPRGTKDGSRDVPAHVCRAVWKRDGGRCAFAGKGGRCTERRYLEWHHVQPFGHQGPATVDNISLRCRAHNVYESELVFGRFDPSIVREALEVYGVSREIAPFRNGGSAAASRVG
jgi:hypothetical protein